ncbi:MAG: DUF2225 domain-containing protein [Defluviitaleaceae bacterium]|nr:DUF2225 domain-containing protein [Defluviitaleaceae bacterium]
MDANIFAGLEGFGLTDVAVRQQEIFKSAPEPAVGEAAEEVHKFNIDNYIFAKKYTCPVCGYNFESNTVRNTKIRIESTEFDLRLKCSPIEPMLYNVIVCGGCGYSAVTKVFNQISARQSERILAEITPKFRPIDYPKEPSIDEAITRYKLALLNAVVKQAKEGEKAYICMKLTWLYRLKEQAPEQERMFAALTVKGFTNALENETPPVMGIGDSTMMYLIGAFSMFLGENDAALKILSSMIVGSNCSERLKDRARDLKNEITAAKLIEQKISKNA